MKPSDYVLATGRLPANPDRSEMLATLGTQLAVLQEWLTEIGPEATRIELLTAVEGMRKIVRGATAATKAVAERRRLQQTSCSREQCNPETP